MEKNGFGRTSNNLFSFSHVDDLMYVCVCVCFIYIPRDEMAPGCAMNNRIHTDRLHHFHKYRIFNIYLIFIWIIYN